MFRHADNLLKRSKVKAKTRQRMAVILQLQGGPHILWTMGRILFYLKCSWCKQQQQQKQENAAVRINNICKVARQLTDSA